MVRFSSNIWNVLLVMVSDILPNFNSFDLNIKIPAGYNSQNKRAEQNNNL